MKMKRFLSIALVMTVLVSVLMCTAVSADDFANVDVSSVATDANGNLDGWTISTWSNYNGGDGGSLFNTTSEYAHSGTYSLLFRNGHAQSWQQHWRRTTQKVLEPSTNYTVEVWSRNNKVGSLYFGSSKTDEGAGFDLQFSSMTLAETDENGWKKYTGTFNSKADEYSYFTLQIWQVQAEAILDDIVVYRTDDAEKINVVPNGTFEPSTFVMPTIDLTKDGHRLTNNYWKMSTYLGHKTTVNLLGIESEKRGGRFSGYFAANNSGGTSLWYNTSTVLEAATSYTAEFYSLGPIPSNFYARSVYEGVAWGWGEWEFSSVASIVRVGASGDWVKYRATFTSYDAATKNYFAIQKSNGTDAVIIDDIVLYKTSDTTKTNILSNGDFENVTYNVFPEDREYLYVSDSWVQAKGAGYAGEGIFIEPTDAESYDGNYSMHSVFPTSLFGTGNNYLDLMDTSAVLPESGASYDISVKAKGKLVKFQLRNVNGDISNADMTASEADENGWITYSVTATLTSVPIIRIWQAGNFYFDDFVVAPAGTTENIYSDGSFESVNVPDSSPTHVIAYPVQEGGALNVSWINPSIMPSKVEVLVNGTVEETITEISTGAKGEALVSGLTNGTEYSVTVRVTDKADREFTVSTAGTPSETGTSTQIKGWDIIAAEDAEGVYNDAVASLEAPTGGYGTALKISANITDEEMGVFVTQSDVVLTEDMGYQLSFKAYADDYTAISPLIYNTSTGIFEALTVESETLGSGWKQYTCSIDYVENAVSLIGIRVSGTGDYYLDDICLYEVDFDEIGTENLFSHSDFETYSYIISEPVFELNGEVIDDISSAGTVSITTAVKNNEMGAGFGVTIVAALYNGERLVSVSRISKTVAQTAEEAPAEETALTVAVPEIAQGDDYSIKVMFLDGMGTLKPLSRAYSI